MTEHAFFHVLLFDRGLCWQLANQVSAESTCPAGPSCHGKS
jgi:hypothetical protein